MKRMEHIILVMEMIYFSLMEKFPIIIQPTWRANPLKVGKDIPEQNETYGQKYIKARMLADIIKVKSKGGSIIIWIFNRCSSSIWN